jgi:hypothetical protein
VVEDQREDGARDDLQRVEYARSGRRPAVGGENSQEQQAGGQGRTESQGATQAEPGAQGHDRANDQGGEPVE